MAKSPIDALELDVVEIDVADHGNRIALREALLGLRLDQAGAGELRGRADLARLAVSAIGEKGKPMIRAMESLSQVMFKLTNYVMMFAPVGVAANDTKRRSPTADWPPAWVLQFAFIGAVGAEVGVPTPG